MITEKKRDKIEIDLTGPKGNAYALISLAKDLSKQLNKLYEGNMYDAKEITDDMASGDYEHLIEVLEKHFGEFIILYR
jgi:hypothetical protein